MKNKVFLLGLPRSGTTIITKYFTSAKDRFFFSEPHWEYMRNKKIQDLNLDHLSEFGKLSYDSSQDFPMDNILNQLLEKYRYVGFKETYRSNIYEGISKNPLYPNQDLAERYRDNNDYSCFVILRNPVDVFNSWVSFDVDRKTHTAGRLDLFLEGYKELITNFRSGNNTFVYELFVKDPAKVFSSKTGLYAEDIRDLTERTLKGDKIANDTNQIEKKVKENLLTDEELDQIKESEAMKSYLDILAEESEKLSVTID